MARSKPSDVVLRVLVVERHDPTLARIVRMLPATIECVVARSTSDALAQMGQSFSCAIVDLDLPGAGALLTVFRDTHASAAILVSGERSQAAREAIAATQATHVDRPIDPSMLSELDAWIVSHRPWVPTQTGRFPAPRLPMRPTPMSIRRSAFRTASGEALARIPEGRDTIVCVGERKLSRPRAASCNVPLEASHADFERLSASTRSIAAVVVESASAALDSDGFVSTLRVERPDTPVLVVTSWIAPLAARQLSLRGIALAEGDRTMLDGRADHFVEAMLEEADVRRHVLDARALDWGLTNREAELAWLCSMITSRARVQQLFNGGGFRAQLESARRKVGAATFEDLGRIARS